MSEYRAPIRDMQFVLKELAGLEELAKLPGCEEATPDVVDAVLEEAAKFAEEVLSPLNASGDKEGARFSEGKVTTPKGFKEAYRLFAESGWTALGSEPEWGGQGLPRLVATPVAEMWKSANHAFSLCPLLTGGAIDALVLSGSDELKKTFLEKMVTGEWTGTMNLTEPQAGSDVGALTTTATPQAVEDVFNKALGHAPESVVRVGNGDSATLQIRTETLSTADTEKVRNALFDAFQPKGEDGKASKAVISDSAVSSTWGDQITKKALIALVVFIVIVSIYITIRYERYMALAALASLAFDLISTAGVYSLVGFEVTPATVIGLLTILGFSLYDTVIVFDKVEENTHGFEHTTRRTFAEQANLAVNQVLIRSINTTIIGVLPVAAPDSLERVRPLLQLLGTTITHVGGAGSGQVAKACNQIVQVINIEGIAEAMLFARAQGTDPSRVLAAIGPGFAGSRMLDLMGPKMAGRDFAAGIEARYEKGILKVTAPRAEEDKPKKIAIKAA